jgi:hypothetical protein
LSGWGERERGLEWGLRVTIGGLECRERDLVIRGMDGGVVVAD